MIVTEDPVFSKDYLDPEKRSVANSLQIEYQDGTFSQKVTVVYPIGHRRRREEALPLLKKKFVNNMKTKFDEHKVQQMLELFLDKDNFESTTIDNFMQMLQSN
jgi:2-methylcitrate dehydratase